MNIRTSKKYLLLIPLVFSLIMLTFFSAAYDEIVREKHEQKFNSTKIPLSMIVSQIDRFVAEKDDWMTFDYIPLLKPMIEEIDALPVIYAELFDHNLTSLTNRTVEDHSIPFNFLAYPECVAAIKEGGDEGQMTVHFDDENHPPYDMYLSFRKIPSGDYDNKFTAVIGLGIYAIENDFAPWLVYGEVGLVLTTVVLQIWMILYISKLSDAERLLRECLNKRAGENACS